MMTTEIDLQELMGKLEKHVAGELASMPRVDDVGNDLDLGALAVGARRWARVNEIVAVVADLKNSTQFNTGTQRKASTASIYEAAIRPLVDIYVDFEADDIAI